MLTNTKFNLFLSRTVICEKKWSEFFSGWGRDARTPLQRAHDIGFINRDLVAISNGLLQINKPILQTIKTHNMSIKAMNDAATRNRILILQRTDKEKQEALFQEMKNIRDYYIALFESEIFEKLRKDINLYSEKSLISIDIVRENIEIIKNDRNIRTEQLKGLMEDEDIQRKSLINQIRMRGSAIEALEKYLAHLNLLPERIRSLESSLQRFEAIISSNKETLTVACETLEVLTNIQTGLEIIKSLQKVDDINKEIIESWKSISNIIDILKDGTINEIDRNKSK
jgi:hypothetical protein